MSDEQITVTVPGAEWWHFAGFITWGLTQRTTPWTSTPAPGKAGGVYLDVRTPDGELIGRVTVTSKGDRTTICVDNPHPRAITEWKHLLDTVKSIAGNARDARHLSLGRTYDEAIENFYRAKARGTKITLKQVAVATGLHYGYLREKKAEYDQRGGYGSKKHSDKPTDNQ